MVKMRSPIEDYFPSIVPHEGKTYSTGNNRSWSAKLLGISGVNGFCTTELYPKAKVCHKQEGLEN